MKISVWYHAVNNEIWVKPTRNRIERGCQALIQIVGQSFSVPDHCNLYTWKCDMKKWKDHMKNGWLVKLGEL